MKILVCKFAMLVACIVALTGLALAQQFAYRVAADIPSDFYVGDQHFAAGNYIFSVNYGDHAVTITNEASRRSSVVQATPVAYASPGYDYRNKPAVVELNSLGGRYQLADIKARNEGVSFSTRNPAGSLAEQNAPVTIVASLR